MSLREYIRHNREELDEAIRTRCPNVGQLDDEERRLWVLNDELLYLGWRAASLSPR